MCNSSKKAVEQCLKTGIHYLQICKDCGGTRINREFDPPICLSCGNINFGIMPFILATQKQIEEHLIESTQICKCPVCFVGVVVIMDGCWKCLKCNATFENPNLYDSNGNRIITSEKIKWVYVCEKCGGKHFDFNVDGICCANCSGRVVMKEQKPLKLKLVCPNCGHKFVDQGTCWKCLNCGNTLEKEGTTIDLGEPNNTYPNSPSDCPHGDYTDDGHTKVCNLCGLQTISEAQTRLGDDPPVNGQNNGKDPFKITMEIVEDRRPDGKYPPIVQPQSCEYCGGEMFNGSCTQCGM